MSLKMSHSPGLVTAKDNSEIIDRISCDVSYTEFFERFMLPNIPCIITEDITKSWLSRKYWVCGNKPNFQYLQEKFGNTVAPVANCKENYHGSQKKNDMPISEFLSYWKDYILKNYPSDMPVLYLKDWHLKKEFPNSSYYQVPSYFASDWLNEFWSQRKDICDDYRFVYMGPKGSWTPEHVDVFSSYSWSANILGRKQWRLYPPKSNGVQNDPSSLDKQASIGGKVIEVIQETGEVIFVPSGWRHEVFNLEDTISINHNWVSGCNVEHWMWPSLSSALIAVEVELEDCLQEGMDSWEEQCQILLRAVHGIDFLEFYTFLRALAEPRIRFLLTLNRFSSTDVLIQQEISDKSKGTTVQLLEATGNVEFAMSDSCKNLEDAKEEPLSLCYDLIPVQVVQFEHSNMSLSQKMIELESKRDKMKDEMQAAMLCENGWWLGMLHALYDVWKIQRVMESFMSHRCLPKLEVFQKLTCSKSHLQFMHNLNFVMHCAEAHDISKEIYSFT